jgi:hypothetical protein
MLEAIEAADDKDELIEVARQLRGTFQDRPFWPRLIQVDRPLAAELQAAVKKRAATLELDLASV